MISQQSVYCFYTVFLGLRLLSFMDRWIIHIPFNVQFIYWSQHLFLLQSHLLTRSLAFTSWQYLGVLVKRWILMIPDIGTRGGSLASSRGYLEIAGNGQAVLPGSQSQQPRHTSPLCSKYTDQSLLSFCSNVSPLVTLFVHRLLQQFQWSAISSFAIQLFLIFV